MLFFYLGVHRDAYRDIGIRGECDGVYRDVYSVET